MESRKDVVALLGRIALASIFVLSGFNKLMGFSGTAGAIAGKGLPLSELLAAIAILIELGGGLAIVLGWKARWAALAFVVFLIVITPIFHNFWDFALPQRMGQLINFQKNLMILGGMLLLVAFGPGRLSLERSEREARGSTQDAFGKPQFGH